MQGSRVDDADALDETVRGEVGVTMAEVVRPRREQAPHLRVSIAVGEGDASSRDLDLAAGMVELDPESIGGRLQFRRLVHVAGDEMHRQRPSVVPRDQQIFEQIRILDVAQMNQHRRPGLAKHGDGTGGAFASSMTVRKQAKACIVRPGRHLAEGIALRAWAPSHACRFPFRMAALAEDGSQHLQGESFPFGPATGARGLSCLEAQARAVPSSRAGSNGTC